jgi:hypothetical protein
LFVCFNQNQFSFLSNQFRPIPNKKNSKSICNQCVVVLGCRIIINGGIMVFILFLLVSWDEQAIHGMRGSGINGIPFSWVGQPPHGKPKNVEERRNNRRHILQEPDQPGRNLLGLTSKPLPQRLHRLRHQALPTHGKGLAGGSTQRKTPIT